MKNIALLFVFILCMSPALMAQKTELSKDDKKKIAKEKKSMDPGAFKDLYEGYVQLKRESEALQRQITNMGKKATDKQAEIETLRAQLDSLRNASATGNYGSGGGGGLIDNDDYSKGIVYKVQVGDIKEAKLGRAVFDKEGNYIVEKDDDGKLKYTLGYFRNYWEAIEFKDHLRKIGVKTAYAVAYKDGKLVAMKEARESDPNK